MNYRCKGCPDEVKARRRCADDSFDVLKQPLKVHPKSGLSFAFCPGKATWYPWVVQLFEYFIVAVETGILPEEGGLADQEDVFIEAFPVFVGLWKEQTYGRIWHDVRATISDIFESFSKKAGGGGTTK